MPREVYKRIRFDARDKETIKEALRTYVQANRPDLESDLFDSKLGDLHMDALSFLIEGLAVQQDINAQEVFLETCERYSSALKHARKLGYKARRALAASATCVISPVPAALLANGGTVESGTKLSSGNIVYEVLEDQYLAPGLETYAFTAVEGDTRSYEFVSEGAEFTVIETEANNNTSMSVVEGSWEVRVDGVLWEEVESIFTVIGATDSYQTEQTDDGQLRIIFGDNITGRIPENGAIISISYRDCLGEDGLVPAGALSGNIVVSSLPSNIRVSVINPEASSGALNRESIESIKRYAPAYFKTTDKLITREDYQTLASSFSDSVYGSVSKATVKLREGTLLELQGSVVNPTIAGGTQVNIGGNIYQTLSALSLVAETNPSLFVDPNTVDVYLWGETNDIQYYGPASNGLKEAFLAYAESRSVVTVRVNVKDGGVVPINLNFGTITVDRAYELDNPSEETPGVNQNIESALEGFFQDVNLNPGDTFRVSDIVNLIEEVPGVLHFVLDVTDDIEIPDTSIYVRGTILYETELELRDTSDFRGRY